MIPEEIFPVVESQPCEQSIILSDCDFLALEALAAPSTFFEFSSSPTSSFFLHISSQRREQAKTGTPAGRFDPYY